MDIRIIAPRSFLIIHVILPVLTSTILSDKIHGITELGNTNKSFDGDANKDTSADYVKDKTGDADTTETKKVCFF